jgi:hypothetical protein
MLDPPSPDKQSLLVLPVSLTKKAQNNRHGFYYIYRITSDNNQVAPYDAVIKFPNQHDMVIVDHLPPGSYRVSSFSYLPVGTGTKTYNNNSRELNIPFTLAPGTITILSQSFNLLTYNSIPGRSLTTSYSFDIDPVTDEQRRQILDKFGKLTNFQSWKVLDSSNPHVARAQGRWAGKWESKGSGDCGNGELRVMVVGSEMSGSGTSENGESLTVTATINDQGKVTGDLSNAQGLVAKVSGGVYWGGEIAGTLNFVEGCESDWSVLKKG